jgi:nucleotide-binding universal stress UspA family protein
MVEIKKIVTPVDFGKNTDKLVEYALYVADKLSAQISFFHVVEPYSTGDMMLGSPSFGELEQKRKADAEQRMANLVQDKENEDRRCFGKVCSGDVVDEIVAFAREEKADLIIIGTHGAKGLEKILLGSVAERVLKNAHCPSLVMNPYK